jgi:hypothetical protein
MALKTFHFTPNQTEVLKSLIEEKKFEVEDFIREVQFSEDVADKKIIQEYFILLKQIHSQFFNK